MPRPNGQVLPGENQWILGHVVGGPTPEQIEILCREAAGGASMTACAAVAELPYWTVRKWVQRGREAIDKFERGEELRTEGEHRMAEFAWKFSVACAKRGKVLEGKMDKRAEQDSGTWLAYFKKMERLHAAEWADHTRAPTQQGGVQIVIAGMLPERTVQVGEIEVVDGEARADEGLPPAPPPRSLPR